MIEINAYNEALKSGLYQKPGGLRGKYDNVRRFWEDEQVGLYLRPYLEKLVSRRNEHGERIRVMDLGCGSGDGYELLAGISSSQALLSESETKIIRSDSLEFYRGIDINEGLLEQARSTYGNRQNMGFIHANFNDYDFGSEEPCDLYLANYGALSHNTDAQTVALLSNMARHGRDGAVIIIDWLGRFSYEWQTLWTMGSEPNQWIDYAISYIYQDDDTNHDELTYFRLRLMSRNEVLNIFQQARKKSGGILRLHRLADRSSLVGRHMDTAQYNPHCPSMRRLVNSLFEPNVATDLNDMRVHYIPRDGFDEANAYYEKLTDWWNYLVADTDTLLKSSTPPRVPPKAPAAARRVLDTMRKTVKTAEKIKTGTPRTSLVEPQLAYCLRELESGLQEGLGCGHGLVAIFGVVK